MGVGRDGRQWREERREGWRKGSEEGWKGEGRGVERREKDGRERVGSYRGRIGVRCSEKG